MPNRFVRFYDEPRSFTSVADRKCKFSVQSIFLVKAQVYFLILDYSCFQKIGKLEIVSVLLTFWLFFEKCACSWLLDFFRLGSKRDLELSDLYRLSKEARSENLGNKLADAWKNQIHQAEKWNSMNKGKPRTPSLLRALSKVFFWQYAVIGLIAFFEECVLKYVAILVNLKNLHRKYKICVI